MWKKNVGKGLCRVRLSGNLCRDGDDCRQGFAKEHVARHAASCVLTMWLGRAIVGGRLAGERVAGSEMARNSEGCRAGRQRDRRGSAQGKSLSDPTHYVNTSLSVLVQTFVDTGSPKTYNLRPKDCYNCQKNPTRTTRGTTWISGIFPVT